VSVTAAGRTLGADERSVVIVGGGIAGLYSAYLLGQLGLQVELFEASDRFGGRIESERFDLGGGDTFIAEFGPMRFEVDLQDRLRRVCFHLGIAFDPFSPTGSPENTMNYDLTDVESSFDSDADLLKWAVLRMFFEEAVDRELTNIRKKKYKIGPLQLKVLQRHMDRKYFCKVSGSTTVTARSDEEIQDGLAKLRKRATLRGRRDAPLLSELGLWNALSEIVSPGALARIREHGTFYHLIAENPSALEWGIFWLRQASVMGGLFQFTRDTAEGGTRTLVDRLVERIEQECDTVHLRLGHEVVRVEHGKRPDEVAVRVTCRARTRDPFSFSQRTDHVILALPQQPLQLLDEHFPTKVRNRLRRVLPLPLLKAFLVTRNPWWRPHLPAQTFAWMVPTRELHFFRPGERACRSVLSPGQNCDCKERLSSHLLDHGMIMLYTDEPAIAYWRALMPAEEHRKAIWKLYDGDEAIREVTRDRYGLLATLIRRLIMSPHLSLARDINAKAQDFVSALAERNPSLEQRVRAASGSKLAFAEQLYKATERSSEDESLVYEVLCGQEDFEVDANWRDLVGRALMDMDVDGSIETHTGEVCAYGIRDWSAAPFGGAAHVWRPGARSRRASRDPFVAFSLRGREDDEYLANVHICGEAYSGFQGFIEGALRTAEAVVEVIVPDCGAIDALFFDDADLQIKERQWTREQQHRLERRWRESP
jgi:phytoene dehydrogenase-like protein